MYYTVETSSTSKATANSINRSKEGMPATECLKGHQQQLGQMMPATTGTHQVLKKFFSYCRNFNREIFWIFSLCTVLIQHCFICRLLDSTVLEDAGVEPRAVATLALAVRSSNHSARSHPLLGYISSTLS
jgi:hypothetical protein